MTRLSEGARSDKMAGNTAAAFLRKLRPSGPWVLTSIHPDKGWITTITAKTSDEVGEFVCKWNGKRNLYYSVNPTRTDMTKKASKADIGTIEYLLADLDPKDNETVRDAKARYIWALQHSKPVSTATVDSGNGIQALWRLATPVGLANGNKELIKDVENRVAKLIEGLGGEAGTQNIDRILRLPGTINLPNAKKRKAGRVACPAKLLNFNCVTCKLSDFPLDAPDRLENAPQTEPDETIEAEDDGNDRGLNYIEMGLPDELMRSDSRWCA